MDLKLAGKSVLVAGASKGIGPSITPAFAAEGDRVALAARSTSASEWLPSERVALIMGGPVGCPPRHLHLSSRPSRPVFKRKTTVGNRCRLGPGMCISAFIWAWIARLSASTLNVLLLIHKLA